MAPPILVTGSHRSGTTWVGRMLALDPRVRYIHEPFNVDAKPSKLRVPVDHWFQYVCPENEAAWLEPMSELIRGTYPPRKQSLLRLLRPRRPLLKDPIALMAAPWLADRFGAQVVVMIRHPAAFASSLKRLDWRFDFTNWTSQPLFMRDLAGPYEAEIRAFAEHGPEPEREREPDIIDQAILLWNVMHRVIAGCQASHPDWTFLRHEDLSAAPIDGFRRLYSAMGLRWTTEIEAAVGASSDSDAPAEVAIADRNVTVRDSGAARWTWLKRLTEAEQARIRAGTAEVAAGFYSEADWKP